MSASLHECALTLGEYAFIPAVSGLLVISLSHNFSVALLQISLQLERIGKRLNHYS